jgi:hypothetical protein
MKFKLYQGDCLERLSQLDRVKCIFADPPDNIGLGYDTYSDKKADADYEQLLFKWIAAFVEKADIVWLSFNAKWTATVGAIVRSMIGDHNPFELEFKPCVQVFTFGQHNKNDLGNNHRPLWRLMRKSATLYPDAIKVPSWRQRNGDKRAAAGGRVPGDVFDFQYPGQAVAAGATVKAGDAVVGEAGPIQYHAGDVFDFPRVTGNSAQRCDWHPTQLHEELVERCIKLSTTEGDTVVDPFGGTGTTLRVCMKLDRPCSIIELDEGYCRQIAKLNGLKVCRSPGTWGK